MTDEKPVPKRRRPKHWNNVGYTIPGFAKLVGLSDSTVRRAVDREEIKSIPMGGLRRIPPSEADRVMRDFELKDKNDERELLISRAEHLAVLQPAIVAQMETLAMNATGLSAPDRKSMLALIDILKTTLGGPT